MKTFHDLKCKTYPHEKFNTSKGIIRNKELFLATLEEIKTALEKQSIIDYKKITIRRGGEEIHNLNVSDNRMLF